MKVEEKKTTAAADFPVRGDEKGKGGDRNERTRVPASEING